MSNTPNLHEVVKVHISCELDDHLGLYENIAEGDLRTIVTRAIDTVQSHYYLVPKTQIAEDGTVVKREAPVDAVEDSIAAFWNSVSN